MPRKLEPYVPRPEDIAWAERVTALVRDGGIVGTSDGTFQLDKTNKVFRLISPGLVDATPITLRMLHRHHCVWKQLGYSVEPFTDWDAIEFPDLPEDSDAKTDSDDRK